MERSTYARTHPGAAAVWPRAARTALAGLLSLSAVAAAQLDESCTATLLNRPVLVEADGTFFLPNVPAEDGLQRVRVHCTPDASPLAQGQSELFRLIPNGLVTLTGIDFENLTPIPEALQVEVTPDVLDHPRQRAAILVTGILSDGSGVDMRDPAGGTEYWVSDPRIAGLELSPSGETMALVARERGRVLVGARRDGLVAAVEVDLEIPNDADGDGMTDEFEEILGLDPNDANDANDDPDGDNLSNLREFELGTDIYSPDTDADGIDDGREVDLGTLPADPDTDRDGLDDGQELARGTDPFAPDSDLDGLRDGVEVRIGTDPLVPNLTTALAGEVRDGRQNLQAGASVIVLGQLTAATDAAGRFFLDPVPADQGPLTVAARALHLIEDAAGNQTLEVLDGQSAPVTPVPGAVTEVGLIVVGATRGRISGTVVDPRGGPVPAAWVTLAIGLDRRSANADVTGVFSFEKLTAGAFELEAIDPATGLRGRAMGLLEAEVDAGVIVRLGVFGAVAGRVLGRDGATAAGPGVAVEVRTALGEPPFEMTLTDRESGYRFGFLPPGTYLVDARDEAGNRGRTTVTIEETAQLIEADVVFLGQGTVTGTVEGSSGLLLADAPVEIRSRGLFNQLSTATTGADGRFNLPGVFVGPFDATARHPAAAELSGGTRGEIRHEGDDDEVLIVVRETAGVEGIVFEPDGATPVAGAPVTARGDGYGAATTSDADGAYHLDDLPLGAYGLSARHPLTSDCAVGLVTLDGPLEVRTRDLVMNGLGTVRITVYYASGLPAPGARVDLGNRGPCTSNRSAVAGDDGRVEFGGFPTGSIRAGATSPVGNLRGETGSTLLAGETLELSIDLEPSGSIVGTVFGPDVATPAPNVEVYWRSQTVRTDSAGGYRFDWVKLSDNPHRLIARTVDGSRRAEVGGIVVPADGAAVRQDLVLSAVGSVTGTVRDTAGAPVANASVTVRTSMPRAPVRQVRSGADGRYLATGVAVGDIAVAALAGTAEGGGQGVLTAEGEVITVDLVVVAPEEPESRYATVLWDANNHFYPISSTTGAVLRGSLGIFDGDGGEHRDAMLLEIGQGGVFRRFAAESAALSDDRREVVEEGTDASGLEITRKVRVPLDGYFVRYLEALSNPTGSPITVDLRAVSFFEFLTNVRGGASFNDPLTLVATSSGDQALGVGAAVPEGAEPDRWLVLDALSQSANGPVFDALYPTFGYLFQGPGATRGSDRVTYDVDFGGGYSRLEGGWDQITVLPGETVTLMHFAVQQTGVEAAAAANARLLELPPEALAGLTAGELQTLANFVPPPGGTSLLDPLPPLDGTVTGTVLEGDGTTAVPGAEVRFQSSHLLFHRRLELTADGDGHYAVAASSPPRNDGSRRVVPRQAFVVDATHPSARIVSPAYGGDFPAGGPSARDIVFVDTGRIEGTVRRAGGNVVSFGDVVLRAREQLINLLQPIAADGGFGFNGVPPEVYSLVASQPHPQGSPLVTAGSARVDSGGQQVLADLTMPPTGGVEGLVLTGDGFPAVGLEVVLRGPGFTRVTASDSGGQYRFLDVPAGTYSLRVVEPLTGIPTEVPALLAADEIRGQDIHLFGLGTVVVAASIDGQPAAGAEVRIQVSILGTGFLPAGTTGGDGILRLDEVPVGAFTVRVVHPRNPFLFVEEGAVLNEGGGEITVPVELPVDQPPAVEMVLPVAGSVVPQGTLVTIRAAAADGVGVTRVAFYVNGVEVGVETTAPYQVLYRVTEPPTTQLSIHAVALDNGGNTSPSLPVAISVGTDPVPPAVAVTAPAEGASAVEGTRVLLRAEASDDTAVERVELRADGVLVASDEAAPYTALLDLDPDLAPDGPVTVALEVTAFDFAGNSAAATRALTVVGDAPPSILLVDAPASGTVFTAGEVARFEVEAEDDLGVEVDLLIDGEVAQTRPLAPFRFDFVIPTPEELASPFAVVLEARDEKGQSAATPAILLEIVDDAPPTVAITAPTDGAEVVEGEIVTLQAAAEDDLGVAAVTFFVAGELVAELQAPPWEATARVPVGPPGSLEVRAVATDDGGLTGEAMITLTRREDLVPPTIELTAPADGATVIAGESDIVLILDLTASTGYPAGFDLDGDGIGDSENRAAVIAARALVARLDPQNSRVAIVRMQTSATLDTGLTNDFAGLNGRLEELLTVSTYGNARFSAALEAARNELRSPVARRTARPVAVLLSDGAAGSFPAAEAALFLGHDAPVHTVAVGVDADPAALGSIAAATGGSASWIAAPEDLEGALSAIGGLGIAQLTVAAEAGDDVAVRDVTFRVTGDLLDETLVVAEPPWVAAVPLPVFAGPTAVAVDAEARDFGDNPATASATVTVTPVEATPGLFQLSPDGGVAGDPITLRGRYFSTLPSAHAVRFDGLPAQVVAASKLELQVIVPAGVHTGPVTVTLEGTTTEGVLFRLDSDGDGLSDEDEAVLGTDPFEPDSDGDGLGDGDEVAVHGTDPLAADSDGDGAGDGFEVEHGLDPVDPVDGGLDGDGDGLTNAGEFAAGTDPDDPDTDNDTLTDGDEVHVHGTDPTLADTDGGGRDDAREIADGTDPLDPADDVVHLPTQLVDGGGYPWGLGENAYISGGLNFAFYSALVAHVNGLQFCCTSTAFPEEGGRELVTPRRQVTTGVFHWRKVFVPDDDTFARTLEIIDNETAGYRRVTIRIVTRVGTGVLTQRVATSTGRPELNVRDRYIVTDDQDLAGKPAVAMVLAGATNRKLPERVFTNAPGDDDVEYTFDLWIPPGERRIVMGFAVQAVERAAAVAKAEALTRLEGSALSGLHPDEQARIVNFFAFADADLDRLSDADEAALGTDPLSPDSDGDGLEDGFEVEFGFDPLLADDAGADPDGDGLSNFDEQGALSDPHDPDTDGDGLNDGDEVAHGAEATLRDTDDDGLDDGPEVHGYGTDPADPDTDGGGLGDGDEVDQGSDPLDGTDDRFTVTLPYTFTDGDGFDWDLQKYGAYVRHGTDDAFFSGLVQFVDGEPVSPWKWDTAVAEGFGRELDTQPFRRYGHNVWRSRKIFVPADDGFIRYLEIFSNRSNTEETPFTVELRSSVGSYTNTLIVGTSSGDQSFTADDDWIVTDDLDGFGVPAVVHVFHNPGGLASPSAVFTNAPGAQVVSFTYQLTLPPRGRLILMHFAVQAFDRATALEKAERLRNLGGSALDGLSQDERDDIVNVFPYPDRDFDRLSDEDEELAGTDPDNPDTDGDGLTDGFEVEFGLDPLVAHPDEDGDGIDNLDELALGTHPALPDTDGDLLSDGEEVFEHLTDPLEPDSDLGGVGDGRELLFDGTDPLAAGDDRAAVAINVSASAGEPALAPAPGGNLHAVWTEPSGCRELFYSLVTAEGVALIDDTQLTFGCTGHAEAPQIAVGGDGRVHLLWADYEAIRHLALDPALDDRDGSPSTAETLLVIEPRALVPRPQGPEGEWQDCSGVPSVGSEALPKAFSPDSRLRLALAADHLGRAHVVWQTELYDNCGDAGWFGSQVVYLQLAADGQKAVRERLVFQAPDSPASPRGFPGVAADRRGGVHLVWRAAEATPGDWGIFYAQLAADDGAVRIAPTDLTPASDAAVGYPSIAVNGRGDRVTVAFEDRGDNGPELFLRRIDPTLDDRDGDAADLVAVTVLGRTLLTPDDGNPSTRPAVAVDDLGHLHVSHFEFHDVPDTSLDREVIELAVYEASGDLLLPALAAGESLRSSGRAPRPAPAVGGTSSAVAWSPTGVWLRSFHPDADGDGLSYGLERLAGTDPAAPDSDGDGLVDGFEAAHGFDPLSSGEATGDGDGDGLDNLGEQGAGTDPHDPDSDGDGLGDGDELAHGTDPRRFDSDGDRLADGDELTHGTDPTVADSDGDSLDDGFEVEFGFDPLLADDPLADPDGDGLSNVEEQGARTDPQDPDSDGDGLSDGDELAHGADPRYPDSDGDGLGDGDEVHLHGTDPTAADTDGDDLDDGLEVAAGFDPLLADDPWDDPDNDYLFNLDELALETDPYDADTDDDGLDDGFELFFYDTDPLLADSDGDLLSDGEEVSRYDTDPNAPDSDGDGGGDWQEVVLDGTDPLDAASVFALTRLTGGRRSDQAMPLLDAGGNLHVVWVDRQGGDDEIYYTLLDPAGNVLIDDTRLTDDPASSKRPALAADSAGRIHVVWQDKRLGGESEVFHTAIDPSLDDRDGSPASNAAITVVGEHLLSTDDGEKSNHPRLAIDSQDRVHVVWSDDAAGDVRYVQLAADGTVAVPETLIFTGGEFLFRSLPTPAIDSGDDVHLVLNEQRGTATAELFYLMLDGDSGAPLIDATLITPDDNRRARYPSVGIGPGDQVTVVFQDQRLRAVGGEIEVFMLRLDPALDDRDGDAADPAAIQVLEDRVLSPDDGSKNNHPAAAVDGGGRADLTYYENYVGAEGRGELRFLLADADGVALIPETRLTEEASAVTTTALTRAHSAAGGLTAHVLWTDDRFGGPEVVLRVLNPDVDGDGLSGLEEWLLGTDYLDADSDGGGRSDGQEILDGTDPLDGSDDLP